MGAGGIGGGRRLGPVSTESVHVPLGWLCWLQALSRPWGPEGDFSPAHPTAQPCRVGAGAPGPCRAAAHLVASCHHVLSRGARVPLASHWRQASSLAPAVLWAEAVRGASVSLCPNDGSPRGQCGLPPHGAPRGCPTPEACGRDPTASAQGPVAGGGGWCGVRGRQSEAHGVAPTPATARAARSPCPRC